MTTNTDREQYEKARHAWIAAYETVQAFRHELRAKYHSEYLESRMNQTEARKNLRLAAAEDKRESEFWTILNRVSPRTWHYAPIPWYWIMTQLTYEDAVTAGPLSVTPPPSWNHYPSDVTLWITGAPVY